MNQYEAMFVFEPTFGGSFERCETEIRRLLDRGEAELVFCKLWEERRLAYRIKGCKRGVYVLTFFKAKPDKITPLERDAKISEPILRMLVLRADGTTPEMMEAQSAAPAESTSDSRYGRSSAPAPKRDSGKATVVVKESATTSTAVADKPKDSVEAKSDDHTDAKSDNKTEDSSDDKA